MDIIKGIDVYVRPTAVVGDGGLDDEMPSFCSGGVHDKSSCPQVAESVNLP